MSATIHLVIGPDEHGVVRHGTQVARACGHRLVRVPDAASAAEVDLGGVDVVHVPFTDRLLAPTCEAAAAAMGRLAEHVHAAGAALSVTLHDVPGDEDALARRRSAAYRRVMAASRGVVVNSRVELGLVQAHAAGVHLLRHIDLPVERVAGRPGPAGSADVTVLGFVFPDRGYEDVLHALPSGGRLVALGRPATGHEELPEKLAALAGELGVEWQLTGFVPDVELADRLRSAGVPIAPNRRVTASASIGSWLAHGRRPLVPDCPYTRELAERMPGALRIYDPAAEGSLADAIADARARPDSTWLGDDAQLDPTWDDVARRYREHLAACAPAAAVVRGDGSLLVPGNRWDLIPPRPDAAPRISVVVPYFDAQASLDLVLAALAGQTTAARLEVIVADDGSPVAPDVGAAGDLPVRVVRQPHHGFGAARARNLGASVATGEVLAFLDGDTVPDRDYVERLVRLPTDHPSGLAVGRRRHADLAGWQPADVTGWLDGRRPGPPALPEPDWLTRAYRESGDLLRADSRSYRFVISAVLAMHRTLFERIGGFDDRFDHYGGEDWELAHRAWLAGALVAHVPDAVAWHDGPDWGGRHEAVAERAVAKNVEVLTLSRLLPDPGLRGGGQWFPYVHAVVRMPGDDAAAVLLTARSAFAAGVDCGFWLTGPDAARTAALLADPRVRAGEPAADVRARAAVVVRVHAPCDLSGLAALCADAADAGVVTTPACTVTSTRAVSVAGDRAALLFGRHDRTQPVPFARVDLERDLPGG